ncbi:MAG: anhydro-N-acetylmuramic acid kinase [Bacteroidales bacterium]|nr:anhydro-N-acetylmuramic acid kinase [Bacteroidales bacterium]
MDSIKYTAIGVMSGTSLDGVDLACCDFFFDDNKWSFEISHSITQDYDEKWKRRLSDLPQENAKVYALTHVEYGHYLGKLIAGFIKENNLNPDIIASHGHTIFHQPESGFTAQIGDGAAIAAETGIKTVCDFRSLDLALGGQGAPLVPIGDEFLFSDFDYCLNLGGIANISFKEKNQRIAFDICPANMPLNLLVNDFDGRDYDFNGELAASGNINQQLLDQLNGLSFYKKSFPKSLGKEWFDAEFLPIIEKCNIPIEDKLRTVVEHTAIQISKCCKTDAEAKMLITGGGALNQFLISRIKHYCSVNVITPEKNIIDNKEALIFAFLGVLRLTEEINTLSSVTGARTNSSGGGIYNPPCS